METCDRMLSQLSDHGVSLVKDVPTDEDHCTKVCQINKQIPCFRVSVQKEITDDVKMWYEQTVAHEPLGEHVTNVLKPYPYWNSS